MDPRQIYAAINKQTNKRRTIAKTGVPPLIRYATLEHASEWGAPKESWSTDRKEGGQKVASASARRKK
jgi:hypothetical protein